MAKKDKKTKDKKGSGAADPVEAVRSAVERTLKATGEGTSGAQKRGRDLVDEVAHAAARFREAMGDLKLLDDLKAEVASLRARVAALEGSKTPAAGPRRAAARSTATKRSTTKSRSTAAKSSASKPAASRAKRSSTTSRSRSTATKPTASKPASTRSRSTRSSGSSGSSSS
jgi:DNA-binding protein HU-beta